jgi:hypothetical protein
MRIALLVAIFSRFNTVQFRRAGSGLGEPSGGATPTERSNCFKSETCYNSRCHTERLGKLHCRLG